MRKLYLALLALGLVTALATALLPTARGDSSPNAAAYNVDNMPNMTIGTGTYQFVPGMSGPANGVSISGAASGAVPQITVGNPAGTADANLSVGLLARGTGSVLLGGATGTTAGLQVAQPAGTIVNDVVVTPAATGTAPTIAMGGAGADANRNLSVLANGTGLVTLGGTGGTGGLSCTASGATPQTCNGQRGIVTTNSLSTAAATDASYVINNTSVTANSLVMVTDQGYSGTLVTNGYPVVMTAIPGTNTITVHITNTHPTNALSGTLALGFVVLN